MKTIITVTEAARNFAHCLNRVRYQNASFTLIKNGRPLARLISETERICTGRELAEALAGVELSPREALAWRKDYLKANKSLKNPENKWR
ncbi:MAG TPA: type II toxin-antitoxin system prevent-host-death family antitoxin [Verrucomicrobiae bacterium]